jgi:eukaryotic-like serine/threonine-protein kinase
MAEVYRAREVRLGRIVAVKTLRGDLVGDPVFRERFRREAQSAASLNRPFTIAVYDTGEDVTGRVPVPYIVMEYADGRTLAELRGAGGRLLPAGRWRSPRACCALLTTVTATASCTAISSQPTWW